jgi:hypothetical protein
MTESEAARIASKLTKAQREIMRSYTPETYAINFPRDRVQGLVQLGLLEWLPPVWGNAHNWGATLLGLAVAQHLKP